MRNNLADPTDFAVYCHGSGDFPPCGLVFLTKEEYNSQLVRPNSNWFCPRCGSSASWDDDCRTTNPPDED